MQNKRWFFYGGKLRITKCLNNFLTDPTKTCKIFQVFNFFLVSWNHQQNNKKHNGRIESKDRIQYISCNKNCFIVVTNKTQYKFCETSKLNITPISDNYASVRKTSKKQLGQVEYLQDIVYWQKRNTSIPHICLTIV